MKWIFYNIVFIFLLSNTVFAQKSAHKPTDGSFVDIASVSTVSPNQVVTYSIDYDYPYNPGMTFGVIYFIKDSRTTFVSSTHTYELIGNDTIAYNIADIDADSTRIITIQLQIKPSPPVQPGDILNFYGEINIGDELHLYDTLHQIVQSVQCSLVESNNTTLQSPSGIKNLQTFGGTQNDYGNAIAVLSDSTFVVAGTTQSKDGDLAGNTGNGTDGFIAKYKTDGTLLWKHAVDTTVTDSIQFVFKTADGSILTFGTATSANVLAPGHGKGDIWITKWSNSGTLLWQKLIGGTDYDGLITVKTTPDNNFIIGGQTNSTDGDVVNPYHSPLETGPIVWILKVNDKGQMLWQHAYPSAGGESGYTLSQLLPLSSGNYIIGSNAYTDVGLGAGLPYIFNSDSTGTEPASKSYTLPVSSSDPHIFSMELNEDSTVMVFGNSNNYSPFIAPKTISCGAFSITESYWWLLKLDKNKNILWQKVYGGTNEDHIAGAIKSADGGFILYGSTTSNNGNITDNHGGKDGWIIKITADGKLLWQKTVGGTGEDGIAAVAELPNGDLVVTGNTTSSNTGNITATNKGLIDALVLKISINKDTAALCPLANTNYTSDVTGDTYEWQVNSGSGYNDIADNSSYSGAATKTLQLSSIPTAWRGYSYRCSVTTNAVISYSKEFILKFTLTWTGTVNDAWETAGNWSCNTVPDANTEVIIPSGVTRYPFVNAEAACYKLYVTPNASVTVQPGVNLNVAGK